MAEMTEEFVARMRDFAAICLERETHVLAETQVARLPGETLLSLVKALYLQSDALLLCARRVAQIAPVPDQADDGHRLIRSLASSLSVAFEWNNTMQLILVALADEYPKAPYPAQS